MIMDAGTVYWVTGLSGAGKTTVGSKLYSTLKEKKSNVVMLDGDILRNVFQMFDYSTGGRKSLAFQYSRLCRMLSEQGIDVVICTISMYDEVRVWNRKNISSYVEIYLEVSLEELKKRDQKKLYSSRTQNVVGATAVVELPKNPDLLIRNFGETTADKALEIILNKINKKDDNYRDNEVD
jgi:adenylylsulfate kinase